MADSFRLAPIVESEAQEKTAQTLSRLKELFGDGPIPEPFLIYARTPAFLQDFYMNFKKFVVGEGKLDLRTKAVLGFAISTQQQSQTWIDYFAARCRQLGMTDQDLSDVLAVAAACFMYNVFFKFRDNAGTDVFQGMSVGLRAHTFSNTGLDPKTVELINIAISDLNGCKPCTSGHVEKARQLGVADEAILEAIQCTAAMAAGIAFLKASGG
jgi:alkyl hydroperoxide reductase subunit D